jgi:predicted transcriptional regulator
MYQELRDRQDELEAIAAGVADADAGRTVPHGAVEKWLASWGTAHETKPPA